MSQPVLLCWMTLQEDFLVNIGSCDVYSHVLHIKHKEDFVIHGFLIHCTDAMCQYWELEVFPSLSQYRKRQLVTLKYVLSLWKSTIWKKSTGVPWPSQWSRPDACTQTVVPEVELFKCGTDELHSLNSGEAESSRHWTQKHKMFYVLSQKVYIICSFHSYLPNKLRHGSREVCPEERLKWYSRVKHVQWCENVFAPPDFIFVYVCHT